MPLPMDLNKQRPAISIIVPVYNKAKYLKRCFDSVLYQTFKDFELILVNDGSQDNSLDICKYYEQLDNRVRVIDTPNRGSSSARNTGYSESTGKWIIFFDADDWIDSHMLQLLYDAGENQNADIAACGLLLDDGEHEKKALLYPYDNYEPHSEIYRIECQYSSACNKLVKRELFEKYNIRFVDGIRMWDDMAVTSRLRYHSKKTVIVNQPLYHYYCAPRESICISDIGQYPWSQIKVVEFLSTYFNTMPQSDPIIKKIIASVKITAKNYFFSTESEDEYNRWKGLYPEANKSILGLQHISIKRRLSCVAVSLLSFKNYTKIRNLSRIILRCGYTN